MRLNIEKLPVWKKLAQISGITLQSNHFLSELSTYITNSHPEALKMCASIYLKEELADQNFRRALEYLHRLRNSQENLADQAQTDLDIAMAYVRHSPEENWREKALQLCSSVMENEDLPDSLRAKACFSILRIETYYDLSAFDADSEEIIDSALIYLDTLLDPSNEEANLLDSIIRRDWDADPERDNLLIQEFLGISTSTDAAPSVQCEARLQLVFMHRFERNPELSSKAAFDMAMELVKNPASPPEVVCLAKNFAALIANKNEECNLTKNDIFGMLAEVAESGFANRNALMRMNALYTMFYIAINREINLLTPEYVYQIYSELLEHENLAPPMRNLIQYNFICYWSINSQDTSLNLEIYRILESLLNSPHLSRIQLWLVKAKIVSMNLYCFEDPMPFDQLRSLLKEMEQETGLPEEYKHYVFGLMIDLESKAGRIHSSIN